MGMIQILGGDACEVTRASPRRQRKVPPAAAQPYRITMAVLQRAFTQCSSSRSASNSESAIERLELAHYPNHLATRGLKKY